ncbi:hypothetical protein EJ08DRAFT_735634 [Tothia fuscella]|uniref:Rhodopsin domain-containing protein n=1 Tax=Tothia fuscella TaxID=1048955 RepID=A0A9P4TWZ3_9PEZI|nr:hypothetical protein EJ08DRAFT_735634 [Tothia fuscella]
MSGVRGPLAAVSENDYGPILVVFAVAGSCISISSIAVRAFVAARRNLEFRGDDVFMIAALLASITQSILWGYAAKHGLGKHYSDVSEQSLLRYYKFIYSAQIVGIFAMTFSKASVAFLLKRLTIYHTSFFHTSLTFLGVGIWAIFSLFASTLQCNLPNPWYAKPELCHAREGLWSTIIVLNFLSDFILSIYIIPGVWRLTMAVSIRSTIIVLFSLRLLVCVSSAFQLSKLLRFSQSSDPTWDYLALAITTDSTVHLSLITATIPRIHNFLIALQTGRADARVQVPDLLPRLNAVRSYFTDKTRHDSAQTRTGNTTSTTEADPQSLRLVPNHEISQMSTRIYSSHSGSSNTNVSMGSTEMHMPACELQDLERKKSPLGVRTSAICQRIEFTANVEYRFDGVHPEQYDQYHVP